MTDDSYELVSAYLDGQATEEEVARIEADPSLLQEVAEMRAVSAELAHNLPAADPSVKGSQLAAALDLFDALSTNATEGDDAGAARRAHDGDRDEDSATAPVVDLAQARHGRPAEQGRSTGHDRSAKARPNGVPTWLGVAAGLMIVVGGVGWIATQGLGGDEDSAETASVEFAEDEASSAETATEAMSDEAAEGERGVEEEGAALTSTTPQPALSSPEAADSAADSDAAASEAAEEADDEAAEDAEAESSAQSSTTGGGLFPDEELERARRAFNAVPTADELTELAEGPLLPSEFSSCGADVIGPEPATLLGFVPISVGGAAGEAFVFDSEVEGLVTVVVNGDCAPFN